VAENIEIGLRSHEPTIGWSSRRRSVGTQALLRQFHLTDHADRPAAKLPYGDQRRVELARAVAGRPSVLFVDEPAAGLNEVETAQLAGLLRWALAELGCGIVLIDHDVSFITGACDRVEVLDAGNVIFVGHPEAARNDPRVIEAYLGVSK
jgi:branched-chain amino acid transport system ATP-binding protein